VKVAVHTAGSESDCVKLVRTPPVTVMSLLVNPTGASLKVKVIVVEAFAVRAVSEGVITSVGGVVSRLTTSALEALDAFVAESVMVAVKLFAPSLPNVDVVMSTYPAVISPLDSVTVPICVEPE